MLGFQRPDRALSALRRSLERLSAPSLAFAGPGRPLRCASAAASASRNATSAATRQHRPRPAVDLPAPRFSSSAPERNAGLERLRKVLESAGRRRIPLPKAADAVWDAYAALGSAEDLTTGDGASIAHFLTAHAIAEQGKLRRGPKDGTEAQRRTAKLVDEAKVRTRRLLVDAAQNGGIAIDEKAVTWFIQVNDRLLVSYVACKELMDFLRLECGLTLTARHLNILVRNVAHGGNYTAFLKLLCCAVLDRVPIDAAALPLGKRDLPLAGMSPPRPMPGLLLVIFEGMRTKFRGDRLRILEEKGRGTSSRRVTRKPATWTPRECSVCSCGRWAFPAAMPKGPDVLPPRVGGVDGSPRGEMLCRQFNSGSSSSSRVGCVQT
ncbi:hypothetical protein DFJ74DRAFT_756789 [Hyaloraphidium curvatum]|nr:hypothetical protein DFJ74DRAFT_756789 [Hyaloraphidium curvatum]